LEEEAAFSLFVMGGGMMFGFFLLCGWDAFILDVLKLETEAASSLFLLVWFVLVGKGGAAFGYYFWWEGERRSLCSCWAGGMLLSLFLLCGWEAFILDVLKLEMEAALGFVKWDEMKWNEEIGFGGFGRCCFLLKGGRGISFSFVGTERRWEA